MRQRKGSGARSVLARGLGALGSRMPEAKAGELADKLVAQMRVRQDYPELSELARGLCSSST